MFIVEKHIHNNLTMIRDKYGIDPTETGAGDEGKPDTVFDPAAEAAAEAAHREAERAQLYAEHSGADGVIRKMTASDGSQAAGGHTAQKPAGELARNFAVMAMSPAWQAAYENELSIEIGGVAHDIEQGALYDFAEDRAAHYEDLVRQLRDNGAGAREIQRATELAAAYGELAALTDPANGMADGDRVTAHIRDNPALQDELTSEYGPLAPETRAQHLESAVTAGRANADDRAAGVGLDALRAQAMGEDPDAAPAMAEDDLPENPLLARADPVSVAFDKARVPPEETDTPAADEPAPAAGPGNRSTLDL